MMNYRNVWQEANPDAGSSPPVDRDLSFRERMQQRLSAERDSGKPAEIPAGYREAMAEANPGVEVPETVEAPAPEEEPARQPEAIEAVDEELVEPGAVPEVSDDAEAPADYESALKEWQQRAEAAEEARKSFERDYRIKTHQFGEIRRAMEASRDNLELTGPALEQVLEAEVRQFDQINWQALQQNPQQYQQYQAAWQAAIQRRDGLKQQIESARQQHAEALEKAQRQQAQIGGDVLKSMIPDWGPQKFEQIAEFGSKEFGYKVDEVYEMTDWRPVLMMHLLQQVTGESVKNPPVPTRKHGKAPVNKPRVAPRQPERDAQGRFRSARDELAANPGDRAARRNFFLAKASASRGRR